MLFLVYENDDVRTHKKSGQKAILAKITNLIKELREHPTTGTGNPEPLIGARKGQWSRRITGKHRLIYQIYEDIITVGVISAWGHYGDK